MKAIFLPTCSIAGLIAPPKIEHLLIGTDRVFNNDAPNTEFRSNNDWGNEDLGDFWTKKCNLYLGINDFKNIIDKTTWCKYSYNGDFYYKWNSITEIKNQNAEDKKWDELLLEYNIIKK